MKIKSFSLLLVALFASTSVYAQEESNKSAGVYLSGLTAKFDLSEKAALRTDLSFTLIDVNSVNLGIYYVVYRTNNSLGVESGSLTPYFAPGAQFSYSDDFDDFSFGLHVPLGVEYELEEAPFEIFIEMGPYLTVEPSQILGLSGTIGFRYRL